MKNLDIASLRALISVVDLGGVGRAAEYLNLTQSAISMQIKRLEDNLEQPLFIREKRSLNLTAEGELALGYARKIVQMNDEVRSRISGQKYSGELRLGAPYDIVKAYFHKILPKISREFPNLRIHFFEENSVNLLQKFEAGQIDILLTTFADGSGHELCRVPLRWMGAINGQASKKRPLPLAYCKTCAFRPLFEKALDEAEIPWEPISQMNNDYTKYALVTADLAVSASMENYALAHKEFQFPDDLPPLPDIGVYLNTRQNTDLDFLPAIEELIISSIQSKNYMDAAQ